MKKLWMNSVVALAVCMVFAACGKSNDSSTVSEPAKKEAGELPPGRGSETQPGKTPPKTPSGTPGSNNNGTGNNNGSTNNGNAPTAVVLNADTETMINEARKYSGSADDYLRIHLELGQDAVTDADQKMRNLKLAYLVRSASLKIDYNETGDVAVTVVVGSNEKDQKTILLGGSLSGQREAKLVASSKKAGASGKIKCMDSIANGFTCENAIVSLTMGKANAKILFRRTNVELNAKFPNVNCRTQECEDMYSLFRQTQAGLHDRKTVNKAKLETFEVIQGKSGFRLIVITNQNEVITVGGPLLSAALNPVTNIPADRTLKVEDLVDLRSMQNYKTNMQHSLNDVRIVGNNGRGKINLQVKMKMLEDGVQDQFQLNLVRIQRDVEATVEVRSSNNLSAQ